MKNRIITGLILSVIFSLGSGFVFPEVIVATSVNIGVYVFISSAIVLFSAFGTQANTERNSATVNGETTTLYVGNLPYKANEEAVKTFFGEHVPVQSVRLMKDKRTGKRKGYGFIEIVTEDVNNAINELNDIVFQDRTLKVRPAKEKVEG